MEIGDQSVNRFKFIAWIDKDLCPATSGFYDSVFSGCGLQGTAAGSSHRNHSSAVFLCVIDQFRLIFLHNIKFRMHMMFLHIIHFYRTERSKAYMQSYMGNIHAHFFYLLKKFRCEMQSCCRCGGRSFIFCIYSLITVFVFQLVGNIRRQRHFSQLIQDFLKDSLIMELDQAISLIYDIDDLAL